MIVTKEPGDRWVVTMEPDDSQAFGSCCYREALERYLNKFEVAFSAALQRSEFEFICCLLRVRGLQGPGWDPYKTTLRAISALVELHERHNDGEAARHLGLWIYGHIVEASEPYELLANLLDVASGGRFQVDRFPPRRTARGPGRPQTPGEKIEQIAGAAAALGIPQVAAPLQEVWDRDLRNAIFHADYSFHGDELRLLHPTRIYTLEEELRLQNRAIAYHDTLKVLDRVYREGYTEPIQIPAPPGLSQDPDMTTATVMVKDGRGVIGLKDSWTPEQIASGKIPFCLGRFTPRDAALHMADPTRAHFPAEAEEGLPQ